MIYALIAYACISLVIGILVGILVSTGMFHEDNEGYAPIVLASLFVTFAWPCAIFASLFIVIDDRVMSIRHRNKKRAPS